MKATFFLPALAVLAAAHDGHDHGSASSSAVTTVSPSSSLVSSVISNSTHSVTKTHGYGNHTLGYNSTTTAKPKTSATKIITTTSETPESTKSVPSTTAPVATPSETSGATRSQFAMAVLGLAVAAGLVC